MFSVRDPAHLGTQTNGRHTFCRSLRTRSKEGTQMRSLERFTKLLTRGMAALAGLGLLAMMSVTVYDIFMRLFARPFPGTFELVGWLAAFTASFALAYTQMYRQHVAIDLLVKKFGDRACAYIGAVVNLVSAVLFGFVAYRMFVYAGTLQASGSLSETMRVIYYPWVYLVSVGFASLAVALVTDFARSVRECVTGQPQETW